LGKKRALVGKKEEPDGVQGVKAGPDHSKEKENVPTR